MIATGFLNSATFTEYTILKNGEPFDLNAAGVVRVQVVDEGVTIDSDDTDVNFSGSTLSINWGALDLKSGRYSPTIYAYKAGDTKGEVIFGPEKSAIYLTLVEDERPL